MQYKLDLCFNFAQGIAGQINNTSSRIIEFVHTHWHEKYEAIYDCYMYLNSLCLSVYVEVQTCS